MQLTEVPEGAFGIRLRSGQVTHYKVRHELKSKTRLSLLALVNQFEDGEVVEITPLAGEWKAVFVQAVNLDIAKTA